jgi:hypothetical protein
MNHHPIPKRLAALLETQPAACTLCGRPFAHGARSYGGVNHAGTTALVGDCCAAKLRRIQAVGDFHSPSMAEAAKRAGLAGGPIDFIPPNSPWVRDDRAWFATHPGRSHRVRPAFPGETGNPPSDDRAAWVAVRQIAPGQTAAIGFTGPKDVPIPDDEAVAHATFDIMARSRRGEPTAGEDFVALVERYSAAGRAE